MLKLPLVFPLSPGFTDVSTVHGTCSCSPPSAPLTGTGIEIPDLIVSLSKFRGLTQAEERLPKPGLKTLPFYAFGPGFTIP